MVIFLGMSRSYPADMPAIVLPYGGWQGVRVLLPYGGQLSGDLQRTRQGPAVRGCRALPKGPRTSQIRTLCARPLKTSCIGL